MLEIRVARVEDAADLIANCWQDRDLESVQDFIRRCRKQIMKRGRGMPVVALSQDEAIGFGMLTKWGAVGEISDLIVAPELRSRGIGSAMIAYLMDEAHTLSLDTVEIGAAQDNPRARALYERLGFTYDRTVSLTIGDELEAVDYLTLNLDP